MFDFILQKPKNPFPIFSLRKNIMSVQPLNRKTELFVRHTQDATNSIFILVTELQMTEWKSNVPYSSSSQSSIALKNLLADGRQGQQGSVSSRLQIVQEQDGFKILNFMFHCAKFSSNFAKFKIMLSKFRETQNFDKIILNFAKFEEKFAKQEIENFAKLRKRKICSHLMQEWSGASSTLTQIVHYSIRLPIILFSILSSIIL